MRQETSNRAIQRRGFGAVAVAALVGAVALLTAGPALARNEFENGFEDQLGRIAAYGAVNLGLQVLTGGYYPAVVPVPVAPVAYYGPSYAYAYPVRHVVRHKHGWNCGHDYDGGHGYNRGHGYDRGYSYNRYDDDRGHRSHGKKHRNRGW